MRRNPKIKIYSVGKQWFNYALMLPQEDGTYVELKRAARVHEEIEIPIYNEYEQQQS